VTGLFAALKPGYDRLVWCPMNDARMNAGPSAQKNTKPVSRLGAD
jgi:hypothetical protein